MQYIRTVLRVQWLALFIVCSHAQHADMQSSWRQPYGAIVAWHQSGLVEVSSAHGIRRMDWNQAGQTLAEMGGVMDQIPLASDSDIITIAL